MRQVATAQLFIMGAFVSVVAVALCIAAIAIVVLPFALGREGVGIAMVSLFGCAITAVVTTLPLFAARGAARILRCDARGIPPVNRVAWLTVVSAAPLGVAGALALNYASPNVSTNNGLSLQSKLFLLGLSVFVLLALWSIVVLRSYRRKAMR